MDKMMKGDDSFQKETPPSAAFVRWFLGQGDTTSEKSPLHYLGIGPGDAAYGNHVHDGSRSPYLWDPGTNVATGDLATTAGLRSALKAVLTAMAKQGFKDSTTN
jgi:hypothetical protein